MQTSWDIFCRVVDNYGDIGVCGRLARQLAAEHGARVRLWVDDLAAFKRIWPDVAPERMTQSCLGIEIVRWTEPFPPAAPADVVVEAFACALPESYMRAMAERPAKPCWINLEYLSAEAWVGECHGLASPDPRLPLTKYFFFPGFDANTGGVLLERDLFRRRQAFQSDTQARAAFWRSLGLAPPDGTETRLSLFCYPGSRAEMLFDCWREEAAPITCLAPEGIAGDAIAAFFGQSAPAAGGGLRRGNLEVRVLPFLDQERYDCLLSACDCNFVRGEDSFVRAQWAARPLVWQPYPQAEDAHLRKLAAFLERYCKDLPTAAAGAVRALWEAWSRAAGAGEAWPAFRAQNGVLARHALTWAASLRANGDGNGDGNGDENGNGNGGGDLAARLVKFCSGKL
jgi:uncharacterized repeat protein (TIGR03837 family)